MRLLAFALSAIIFANLSPCLGVYEHIRNQVSYSKHEPYFDVSTQRNISSVMGQTTHLHCTVRDLGDRTVSWIRKQSLHVLTSNVITFTGDNRFSCLHAEMSDSWTLQIRYTQLRDIGEYQCQVNTEPKISLSVFLFVSEARAKIQETGTDKMVKRGSSIELNCTVESGDQVHASMAVFWYLDDIVLDWIGQTGPGLGAKVIETRGKVLESSLFIERARMEHGGRYTCGPTLGISDNITVHIIAGEQTEAIHVNSADVRLPCFFWIFGSLLLSFFTHSHLPLASHPPLKTIFFFLLAKTLAF